MNKAILGRGYPAAPCGRYAASCGVLDLQRE